MTAPVCRCGHDAREHAHGAGRCFMPDALAIRGMRDCPCACFDPAPVVVPSSERVLCVRCGVRHVTNEALPWCGAEGRSDAS